MTFSSIVIDMDVVEQDGPTDRAYHFQERTMSSTKEIEEHVFRTATQPLNPNRPLWRFELIRNAGREDAVCLKLHHCISDGLGVLFMVRSPTLEDHSASAVHPAWGLIQRSRSIHPSESEALLSFGGRHTYTKLPMVGCKVISAARKVYGCTFIDVVMAVR